jgi:hypothetical protein
MNLITVSEALDNPFFSGEHPLWPVLAAMRDKDTARHVPQIWRTISKRLPTHSSWDSRIDQTFRSWLARLGRLGPDNIVKKLSCVLVDPQADWESLDDPAATEEALGPWPTDSIEPMLDWIVNKAVSSLQELATDITSRFPIQEG